MKRTKYIHAYLIAMVLIGLTAAVLRSVACLTDLDPHTLHYNNKVCITIANWLTASGVLIFFTYLFTEPREMRLVPSHENALTYIPSGAVSIALMLCIADRVSAIRSGAFGANPLLRYLTTALIALAAVSVVGFFLMVLIRRCEHTAKAVMLICVALYLTVYCIYLYFNKSVHPTNSPNKIVDQLAYLSSAIFMLFEARISIGRAKWKLYVTIGLCAALLCAYSGVPSLVAYLMNGTRISDSLYETALTLAVGVFIIFRLFLTARLGEDEECPAVECICRLDEARRKEMEEAKNSRLARDNNNMEENDSDEVENYQFDIPAVAPRSDSIEDDDGTESNEE